MLITKGMVVLFIPLFGRDIGMMFRVFANDLKKGVQSQVESYQRLKKWYLMPPCLTLSIISYGSSVKWSNPGKGVVPSPIPWCSSYRKAKLRVTLDYGRQLYFYFISTKSRKHSNAWCEGKLSVFRNIRSRHQHPSGQAGKVR